MEKRPFGKPPGSGIGAVGKGELKSELYTKISTRTAVITAHYEHVQPVTSNAGNLLGQGIKQVTFDGVKSGSKSEVIYDVPRCLI